MAKNWSDYKPLGDRSMQNLTVKVCGNPRDIQTEWLDLEQRGHTSLFQTYRWCVDWVDTNPKESGIEPRIVYAADSSDRAVFILPWQIVTRRGVKILQWLTSPLSSYGFGVYSDWCFSTEGQHWLSENLDQLIEAAGPIDAVALEDMPAALNGYVHPLRGHFNVRAPNHSYSFKLRPDYQELLREKRGKASRKNIRWRDSKLHEAGPISFAPLLQGSEGSEALGELLAAQAKRFAELGISNPFGKRECDFFERLLATRDFSSSSFAVSRLGLNGDNLSSIFGGYHAGVCTDLMTSLTDTPLRKFSPGDLVLRSLIQYCCEKRYHTFDLSIGYSDYKVQWTDEPIVLHAIVRGKTLKGIAAALWIYCTTVIRRAAKQNRTVREAYLALRKLRGKV